MSARVSNSCIEVYKYELVSVMNLRVHDPCDTVSSASSFAEYAILVSVTGNRGRLPTAVLEAS